jgi:hypothetical protein
MLPSVKPHRSHASGTLLDGATLSTPARAEVIMDASLTLGE